MEVSELQHHGILGQRWGIRRFQRKDGSLTTAGKKRRGDADEKDDTSKQEEYEARKQKAIKSGSAKEVLKFKGDLTPQEMKYIQDRINWEQNMKSLSAKEVSKGKARADKVFGTMDDITRYAGSAAKLWNTADNIYNAFSKKPVALPKIDTNITNGNRAVRKIEKKMAKEEQQKQAEEQKNSKTNNQNTTQNQNTNQNTNQNINQRQNQNTNQNTNQNSKSSTNDSWDKQTNIKWDTTVSDESINTNASKGKKWFVKNKTTKSKESDSEPMTVIVEGEGTSKGSQSRKKNNDAIVDVVDYEPVSNLPAVRVSSGETYVNNRFLLADKYR